MSERTEISFDAALMMALRADAQKELDELPTSAQLKERYPDTCRWDARLKAALHKRHPVLKRVLVAALTLVILTLGTLAVSADFRKAVYTMIQKFFPIEMQLTYQVDGEPLEQLPNGYSDHYVPDGFERDYEQGYDNEISFLHAYVNANDKSIFYYVDCSVIQDYGQVETFDNEHTEDCFSVLSKRLVEFPEDTLCILNHNKLMADTDFEVLVITGIGAELPYIGSAEEKDTLYKYLKSISTDEEYAEIASRILDEWLSESDGS